MTGGSAAVVGCPAPGIGGSTALLSGSAAAIGGSAAPGCGSAAVIGCSAAVTSVLLLEVVVVGEIQIFPPWHPSSFRGFSNNI